MLGKALANAKIDIVGGDGDYFDRFVNAMSIGKGIDGVIAKSHTLQVGAEGPPERRAQHGRRRAATWSARSARSSGELKDLGAGRAGWRRSARDGDDAQQGGAAHAGAGAAQGQTMRTALRL